MLYLQTVSPATFDLLKRISSISSLSDFSLAGGTALSLQIGHRISVDLDFFGKREFTADEILDLLASFKPMSIVSQNRNILILNVQGVKVDFVNYKYPLISTTSIVSEGVRLHSLQDIAAMKLAAVAGRGRKRDFIDIYFLLQKFTLRQLMDFYNSKFEDGSEMMVARSLTFFDDAETDEAPKMLDENFSWKNAKDLIRREIRKLY